MQLWNDLQINEDQTKYHRRVTPNLPLISLLTVVWVFGENYIDDLSKLFFFPWPSHK